MLSGSLRKHLAEHNWFAVFIDFIVVVTGILLAFQIQSWAEMNRHNRLELEYLYRLNEDIQIEIGNMDRALETADDRIQAVRLLDRILADPAIAVDSYKSLPWALETATWRSFPSINAFVYTELQNSGNLSLIQSESLRRKLANHYSYLEHESQVGLDLEAQRQFEANTIGILTIDELVAVENSAWGIETSDIRLERAMEIETSLRDSKAAGDLLPSLIHHHTFNKKVISVSRERALEISSQIETLIAEAAD